METGYYVIDINMKGQRDMYCIFSHSEKPHLAHFLERGPCPFADIGHAQQRGHQVKLNFPHLPDEGSRANGNCAVSKWNSRMKGGQRLIHCCIHAAAGKMNGWIMEYGEAMKYREGLKCGPKVA